MRIMRIPIATYRIQFNHAFGFSKAKQIVSYLNKLGVSDIYASPILKAKSGSMHGYDVTGPNCLNPELGSIDDFEQLLKEVKDYAMGWIQDIVPNHMAFDGQNAWLMDVLEKGKSSSYWTFFDIEWKNTCQSLKGKVLAPFLGQFYSRCLENKEIQLNYKESNLTVNYYALRLPLKIETYKDVFLFGIEKLEHVLGEKAKSYAQYVGVIRQFTIISSKTGEKHENHLKKIKRQLWEIYLTNAKIRNFIKQNIKIFNGKKGNAKSFEHLDQLLSKQFFRLTFWKFSAEEINYRRFFYINQLISVKVEDKKVFEKTHKFVLNLVQQGKITGLRIDHIDGLYDPRKYLERLRRVLKNKYIIVEKILQQDEQLPVSWPVQGTTGYEFLNYVNGLFVEEKNEHIFNKIYQQITKTNTPFEELVCAKKRLIAGKYMAGDVDNLVHHMKRISRKNRYGCDITYYGFKRAFVEVLALFPRYRAYIDCDNVGEEDRSVIIETITKAKKKNPALAYELDFIADILLLNFKDYLSKKEKDLWIHFTRRFQQFTGPIMAKGFEDTTLYIYNRLISLNEVGGTPNRFGVSLKEFHDFNQVQTQYWPYAMNATATHDTKRGEDLRARINVLSEIPGKWQHKLRFWQKMNQVKKSELFGKLVPEDNDEYFLYQTMIGGFPFAEKDKKDFEKRLKSYVIKALREAKVRTAWIHPAEKYEGAFLEFISQIFKPSKRNKFINDFSGFQKEIAHYGIFNSLSQMLIKLTVPGVPDFYQGCELWNFSFVDPDNRRPVDFDKRNKLLEEIRKKSAKDGLSFIRELLKTRESGQIKLFLIWKTIQFRNRHKLIFQDGQYVPLQVKGKYKENIIAFARKYKSRYALTIVPRFLTKVIKKNQIPISNVWGNTSVLIPEASHLVDWITKTTFNKKELYIRDIFKNFPGAILTNECE